MTKTLLLTMLLSPAVLFAQKGDFVLKGKIGNLNAPCKLYVMYRDGATQIQDSSELKDGAFEIKGKVEGPTNAIMILKHLLPDPDPRRRDAMYFYIDKGTIVINSPDSLQRVKFVGSPLNEDNERLAVQMAPIDERNKQLNQEYWGATEEVRKSEAFQKSLDAKSDAISADEKVIFLAFIKANPKSYISLDALQRYTGGMPDNLKQLDSIYNKLAPEVRNSKGGKDYASLLSNWKKTEIGVEAPVFTQTDTIGKAVNLADFKGKYVLVDFWASWCGPCRAENPNVVAAFNKYKAKPFTILSVSLDQPTGHDAWLKAISKDGLTWTHVSDLKFWDNAVAKLYGVRSIPQNFLLDPQGRIVAKNLRGEALDKKLAELLPN